MPEAESFNALGVGNGFTTCLNKVDVSGYDYWTTLSGVNEGAPTTSDTLIADSLRKAMKLFWNFNGCSGLNEGIGPASIPFSYTLIIDMDDGDYDSVSFHKIAGGSDSENKTPVERVCYDSFRAFAILTSFFAGVSIIRMYNGVTTDEGNFVGYGVDEGVIQALGVDAEFYLTGWVDGDDTSLDDELVYVTIDGFHLIAWAHSFTSLASPIIITSTASSVTASFDYTGVTGEDIAITSLDFYTYPT
jgi:hypothetical protein